MADPFIIYQTMHYIQMTIVISCLLFGSIMDIIKREVSDIPWLIMIITGIVTTIIMIVFAEANQSRVGIMFGINVGVGIAMGLLLYYTGVMGGADAKAVIALSFNTPVYFFGFAILEIPIYTWIPVIFNTFFNWLLAMVIFYPLPLLFYNIYLKLKGNDLFTNTEGNFAAKILMLISGYLIPVNKAISRHNIVYSEVYNKDKEKWEIKHFMQVVEVEEEEKFKRKVEEDIDKTGKDKIWVKVLPPGIVFLLIGYVVNILAGNLFFLLFHFTLG